MSKYGSLDAVKIFIFSWNNFALFWTDTLLILQKYRPGKNNETHMMDIIYKHKLLQKIVPLNTHFNKICKILNEQK